MSETDFIYISSKIRVLESKILNDNDIDRMVNSTDLEKAFKVLNDTDYSDNLLGLRAEDYREALVRDLQEMNDFLQKTTPSQDLFRLMTMPKDFMNLRLLFKSYFFNVDVDHIIKNNPTYNPKRSRDLPFENHINYPEAMKEYIHGDKRQTLDEDMKEVIQNTIKSLSNKSRPDEVDSFLTHQYYALSLKIAKRIKSDFIIDYFKMSIDVANLIILFRSPRLQLEREKVKEKLIPGGRIDISKMIHFYPDDFPGLKPYINAYFDSEIVEDFNRFCESKGIFQIERLLQKHKADYIKKVKYKNYGADVVFAYYLFKIRASYNVGIILTGKLNHVPSEEIRKTIR